MGLEEGMWRRQGGMGRVLVKGAGAVEELEVERCGCLAVYFSVWGGLHRHCEIYGGASALGV